MPEIEKLHIVYAEDDPGAARLLHRRLTRLGHRVEVVPDGEQALARRQSNPADILLVDHDMPRMTGLEVIRTLAEKGELPPTIMVTGAGNETVAVEAMKLGAYDYIIKDTGARYLELVPTRIEQALNKKRLLAEKRKAEEEVRTFKTISDSANYGCAMVDLDGKLIYINDAFAQMHGYKPSELIGKRLSVLHTDEQPSRVNSLNERLINEGSYEAEEVWHKSRDGSLFPTLMSAIVIEDQEGRPQVLSATAIDITQRRRMEAEQEESQARYRTAVDTMNGGVGGVDQEGSLTYCNGCRAFLSS
ncbi:PAS domain S-box protein [Thermodesulfobacteriota bacterium]